VPLLGAGDEPLQERQGRGPEGLLGRRDGQRSFERVEIDVVGDLERVGEDAPQPLDALIQFVVLLVGLDLPPLGVEPRALLLLRPLRALKLPHVSRCHLPPPTLGAAHRYIPNRSADGPLFGSRGARHETSGTSKPHRTAASRASTLRRPFWTMRWRRCEQISRRHPLAS
jgi:hypothetical protein